MVNSLYFEKFSLAVNLHVWPFRLPWRLLQKALDWMMDKSIRFRQKNVSLNPNATTRNKLRVYIWLFLFLKLLKQKHLGKFRVLHNSLAFRYCIGKDIVLFSSPFAKDCLKIFSSCEQMHVNLLPFLIRENKQMPLGPVDQIPISTEGEEDRVIHERKPVMKSIDKEKLAFKPEP